jgi:radical SAM protein with 4Fe4S-binding SPASM domain
MSYETFLIIIDQFRTSPVQLYLCGLGEPLLHTDLERMVAACTARGIRGTLIHTNGLLLNAFLAERLSKAGLGEIRLSIDGGDETTLQQARPGVRLHRLIRKMRYVTQNTKITASLYFTANSKNWHSLPSLVDVAVEMEVRRIFVADTVPFFDAGMSKATWATRAQKVSEIKEAQKQECLEAFRENCRRNGIEAFESLESFRTQCSEPYHKIYITVNGDVTPCCRIHYQVRVGNIVESGLEKVWHGEALSAWRDMLISGRPAELCGQLCNLPSADQH